MQSQNKAADPLPNQRTTSSVVAFVPSLWSNMPSMMYFTGHGLRRLNEIDTNVSKTAPSVGQKKGRK